MDIICAYKSGMRFLKSMVSWIVYFIFAPFLAIALGIIEGFSNVWWLLWDDDD